jgi:hypothetical protein
LSLVTSQNEDVNQQRWDDIVNELVSDVEGKCRKLWFLPSNKNVFLQMSPQSMESETHTQLLLGSLHWICFQGIFGTLNQIAIFGFPIN